jgi:VanZ family protein
MEQRHPIPFRRFLPGIGWFCVVMVLICTPKQHLPQSKFLLDIAFDKMVHVVCFTLLVGLFYYPIAKSNLSQRAKWDYLIKLCLSAIVWGLATELIQRYFVPGRSFDLLDWLADSVGALLAVALEKWWPRRTKTG